MQGSRITECSTFDTRYGYFFSMNVSLVLSQVNIYIMVDVVVIITPYKWA